MAEARLRSSDPSCRLTSADARLMTPSACTISMGIRSVPIRKLWSDRSVCAPQSRSAGISRGPKASLSVRVPADLPRALAMWSIRDHQNHPSRHDTKPTAPETKMLIASQEEGRSTFCESDQVVPLLRRHRWSVFPAFRAWRPEQTHVLVFLFPAHSHRLVRVDLPTTAFFCCSGWTAPAHSQASGVRLPP